MNNNIVDSSVYVNGTLGNKNTFPPSSLNKEQYKNDNNKNINENDVLKMTENEKVNLWLPSNTGNDDYDVVMGMDIESVNGNNDNDTSSFASPLTTSVMKDSSSFESYIRSTAVDS